jgi:hypothetical protein
VKKNKEGEKLFAESIGSINASPVDTPFDETSYAYRYKKIYSSPLKRSKELVMALENSWIEKKRTWR